MYGGIELLIHSQKKALYRCFIGTVAATAVCQLDTAVPPVVADNRGALNILGRTKLAI